MKRVDTLMLPLAALLLFMASRPASAADQREGAASAAVSGFYSLTFNVNLGSPVPAGVTVTCKAKIAPSAGFFENFGRGAVPVQTATGMAAVTGNQASCTVEIPFSWTVNDPRNGVALNYEIEAVTGSGSLPTMVRTSAQQTVGLPYPPAGGTGSLSFHIVF